MYERKRGKDEKDLYNDFTLYMFPFVLVSGGE